MTCLVAILTGLVLINTGQTTGYCRWTIKVWHSSGNHWKPPHLWTA